MYNRLQAVRVIEVAEHTSASAAGGARADLGAHVIKVERNVGGRKVSYIEQHRKGSASLSDELLDRIDQVMKPGETFRSRAYGYPALADGLETVR